MITGDEFERRARHAPQMGALILTPPRPLRDEHRAGRSPLALAWEARSDPEHRRRCQARHL